MKGQMTQGKTRNHIPEILGNLAQNSEKNRAFGRGYILHDTWDKCGEVCDETLGVGITARKDERRPEKSSSRIKKLKIWKTTSVGNYGVIGTPIYAVTGSPVWICQILQEISQKRTRERMSDQEAKEIKAEAREIMPQPSTKSTAASTVNLQSQHHSL
ncbi:hypothetical protein Tco_0238211 [Tanacetum coccineum]